MGFSLSYGFSLVWIVHSSLQDKTVWEANRVTIATNSLLTFLYHIYSLQLSLCEDVLER